MTDEYWMRIALEEAEIAFEEGNVPIGAVVVKDNILIAKAHNKATSPLHHAEQIVLREALKNDKYLYDYTLYVTIEPCTMCAGSIVLARVGKVVFGAKDSKAGAVGSLYNILLDKRLNHNPKVKFGVIKKECSNILIDFFKNKRNEGKSR